MLDRPLGIERGRRFLGVFTVVDYDKYNMSNQTDNNLKLGLWYEYPEKKVFLRSADSPSINDVYGALRLTETELNYFAATLSAKQDIFECEWAFEDSNAPLEQKLRVRVWVKENTPQAQSARRTTGR